MTLTCISIIEEDIHVVRDLIQRCSEIGADVIEIRLDALDGNSISVDQIEKIRSLGMKSILTLRPADQGGSFRDTETNRIKLLKENIGKGPDMVDLEINIDEDELNCLMELARSNGVETIVSHHDQGNSADPGKVLKIMDRCAGTGCDMVKIVFEIDSIKGSLGLLEAADHMRKTGVRFSLMGTGPYGHLSRILSPQMGSELVYCGLDGANIQGQLGFLELKEAWKNISVGDDHGR